MKKGFTLLEILVVIIVIGILLMIILKMGSGYISSMQLKSDKEELISLYNKTLSQSMSSNRYFGENYDNIGISLQDTASKFDVVISSGSVQKSVDSGRFIVSYLSGLDYDHIQRISAGNIIFQSYKLGCKFKSSSGLYESGNIYFDLIDPKSKLSAYCFKIALSTCRILEYKCGTNG